MKKGEGGKNRFMVYFWEQCNSCKNRIKKSVGETTVDNYLRWYVAYKCPFCGESVEMDDVGLPPDHIRNLLIDAEGKWGLNVKVGLEKKTKLISILRQVLNLSLVDAGKITKLIPGIIIRGSKTEMEWLQKILMSEGLEVAVVKDNLS